MKLITFEKKLLERLCKIKQTTFRKNLLERFFQTKNITFRKNLLEKGSNHTATTLKP